MARRDPSLVISNLLLLIELAGVRRSPPQGGRRRIQGLSEANTLLT